MTKDEAIEYIKKAKTQLLWNPCEVINLINQQAEQIEKLKTENERMKRACKKWEIVW